MKILIDKHHNGLYESLITLLEDRLGHEVYIPIGQEWYEKGFWKIAEIYGNHPDTIEQFLGIRDVTLKDGYYEGTHKAITFEQFEDMDIDIVIATYHGNIEPYLNLVKTYKKKAKFIMQMGNDWPVDWNNINNLMSTNLPIAIPTKKNAVFIHQEFNQHIYRVGKPESHSKLLRSFIHCMMEHDIYKKDWQDFLLLEKNLPEYTFESYGTNSRDGVIVEQSKIGDMMRESKFGVHFKNHGDGYGHVIHNWLAVGRPVIYKGNDYKGKLAGGLLIDGVTGFDYEKGNTHKRIMDLDGDKYEEMCYNVVKTFKENVNFDKEEIAVKNFIENLI